jgi:hypothetical protein
VSDLLKDIGYAAVRAARAEHQRVVRDAPEGHDRTAHYHKEAGARGYPHATSIDDGFQQSGYQRQKEEI